MVMLFADASPLVGDTVHQLCEDFAVQLIFDSNEIDCEPPAVEKSALVSFRVIVGPLAAGIDSSLSPQENTTKQTDRRSKTFFS